MGTARLVFGQDRTCSTITFRAEVSSDKGFQRELGNDVWFVIYRWEEPDHHWALRIRIGSGTKPAERFDGGWLIDVTTPYSGDWNLGPWYQMTDEKVMTRPRHLVFAASEKDFDRFRKAVFRAMSSDSRIVSSGETDFVAVASQIPKGFADIKIVEYKLTPPEAGVFQRFESAKLDITIVTPYTFGLIDSRPATCERPFVNPGGGGK